MSYGDKILKFMYNDSKPNFIKIYDYQQIASGCSMTKEETLPMLRHLNSFGHIFAKNRRNMLGDMDIAEKEISLSSAGIKYWGNQTSIPKKIKSWSPIFISLSALVIAIITWIYK